MRLNHVHLKVADYEKSMNFYINNFEFRLLEENDVEKYLVNKNGDIITLSLKNNIDENLPSWFHFGFIQNNREDVIKLHERFKSVNIEMPRSLTHFGDDGSTFYLLDPDHNKIEISWFKNRVD